MKLILAILQNRDKDSVTEALSENKFQATLLPSSGAFFRQGNVTLMVGVEDDLVDTVIQLIKDNCADPDEPNLKRATVFVINVDRFEQV